MFIFKPFTVFIGHMQFESTSQHNLFFKIYKSKTMSILYSFQNCLLICHKTAVDRIYRLPADPTINQPNNLTPQKSFVIKSDLFRISSKYLRENQNDTNRRRTKINRKKEQIQINNNPELHTLVIMINKIYCKFNSKI